MEDKSGIECLRRFNTPILAANDEMYQSLDNIFTHCLLFLEMSIMPVVGKLSRFLLFFFLFLQNPSFVFVGIKEIIFHGDRVQNPLFIFAGISERILHGDPLKNTLFFFFLYVIRQKIPHAHQI